MDERGIMQGATRVFELKAQGHKIVSTMIAVVNRYGQDCHVAQYRLLQRFLF